jgi:hypothetical protein
VLDRRAAQHVRGELREVVVRGARASVEHEAIAERREDGVKRNRARARGAA